MNTLQHLLSVASLLGAATFLAGQEPANTTADARPLDLQLAVGLAADGAGAFRAVAMDYKATLSASGVEFTPRLGEAAPHNLPLRLATTHVQRGGRSLHEAVAKTPRMDGLRVLYDRGFCTETYDVTPRGLKQSFVFPTPLGGDGDLVVRCRFTSELVPTQADAGAVTFTWPQVGGVRVDSVVGIDAEGRRCAGSVRLVGEALEFVLPDAFLDSASYPLVLDPLLGAAFAVASANTSKSDVAYLPVAISGESLFVFQSAFSATDIDVLAQRRDVSGNLVGGLMGIESTSAVTRNPRVAGVAANSRWLVVWQTAASVFGPYDIECRSVDAVTGALSVVVPVASDPGSEFEPAVGGEATTADDEAIVTWCTDTEVRACQVTLAAAPAVPFVFDLTILATGSTFHTPAIGKVCSTTNRVLFVWDQLGEIWGLTTSRDLTVFGAAALLSGASTGNAHPSCDGAQDQFLVCWDRPESPGAFERDVFCARVATSAGGVALLVPGTAVASLAARDEFEPDVALVGLRYALVFTRRNTTLTDKVIAAAVSVDCTTCGIVQQNLGSTTMRHGSPRISSRFVSMSTSDDALISYSENSPTPPFTGTIRGQRYELFGSGIAPVNLLGGCALGGTNTSVGGAFAIGNPNFTFRVTGADPAAFLFLNLGLPSGGLICGSCTFTNPLALELQANVGGTASFVFALPCDPAVVNFQLESQWISFGTAFSPCPLLGGVSASNRLLFTLTN